MTGKEALIQVSKSCSGLALEFGNSKIGKTDNEALQTLKEIVQKYDKYKRAFEILKYNLEITKTNNICNQPIIEVSCNMFVTPEQGELLEELMKGE